MDVADFAVIGSGIAGVTVAARLAREGTVALLEQENTSLEHSTGKSAANILKSYGSTLVQRFTRDSQNLIREIESDTGAPLLHNRSFLRFASIDGVAKLRTQIKESESLQEIGRYEALKLCSALKAGAIEIAAVEPDASDVDVQRLHAHYLETFISAGGRVRYATKVLSGKWDGAAWLLHTSKGRIGAGLVVNAAGASSDEVAKNLGASPIGLRALKRTVGIVDWPAPPDWPLVTDAAESHYFRPYPSGLLFSPADESLHDLSEPEASPRDLQQALSRVNRSTNLNLHTYASSWAGLRTFSPDRNPVVGFDSNAPSFLWVAGQGGYGIQISPSVANLAAELVTSTGSGGVLSADLLTSLSPERFQRKLSDIDS